MTSFHDGKSGVSLHSSTNRTAFVREIYSLSMQGHSDSWIALHLMKSGVKTPRGSTRWSKSTISAILRNRRELSFLTDAKYSEFQNLRKRPSRKTGRGGGEAGNVFKHKLCCSLIARGNAHQGRKEKVNLRYSRGEKILVPNFKQNTKRDRPALRYDHFLEVVRQLAGEHRFDRIESIEIDFPTISTRGTGFLDCFAQGAINYFSHRNGSGHFADLSKRSQTRALAIRMEVLKKAAFEYLNEDGFAAIGHARTRLKTVITEILGTYGGLYLSEQAGVNQIQWPLEKMEERWLRKVEIRWKTSSSYGGESHRIGLLAEDELVGIGRYAREASFWRFRGFVSEFIQPNAHPMDDAIFPPFSI